MKVNKRSVLEQDLRKHISVKNPIGRVALALTKVLLKSPKNKLDKIYLDDLYKFVKDAEEKDFIHGAFLLANPAVGMFVQRIEVDIGDGETYQDVAASEVVDMLRTKDYSNPITKQKLKDEDFAKQVRMYFVVTKKFWESYEENAEKV